MEAEMEIVLVEDNEDHAEQLIKFLKKNVTNNVRHIQDGAQAVEYLMFECDAIPKLFLLDVVLPSVDGIEVFKMIKSEPKNRNLAVMFLISSQGTKEYLESLGLHPDGFLQKPTVDQLPCRIE
jgi:DNA-binding response OmpR family regulator